MNGVVNVRRAVKLTIRNYKRDRSMVVIIVVYSVAMVIG